LAHFERRLRRRLADGAFLLRGLFGLRWPATGFAATWALATTAERYFGAPPGQPHPTWDRAAFDTWALMLGEVAGDLPAHPIGQLAFYLTPLFGILFVAEGVLKLGFTLFDKGQQREVWVSIHARAARGHVVLCGLGTVGFRVLEELVRLDQQVFAIERDADGPFVAQARALGAEVLVGDARAESMLGSINVPGARSVIIATDDDLANLEIAMDVRELRADIPIVLRLYDQRLAQKVKGVMGVQVSVSTSKLAAPLFAAAALDPGVVGTHRVGDKVLVVLEMDVRPEGNLAGRTVADVGREHGLSVIAVRPADGDWVPSPGPEARIEAYATVQVVVPGERVAAVRKQG
jgi:Trk K+ transport system NAD-binding subunit